jgi:serine/threonine protein kinase
VHRDIKPANVVRAPDGIIKLTDFGIARVVTDQTLARSGTIVGTPNYMSPEQIRGEDVDARTDLFSAGVLMYELLTGKKPFDGPDMTAIMYNVTNIHPPSPRFYNGALPEEIEELAFVSLAKDVSQRFSTASDFTIAVRELDQALRYRDDADELLNALPAAPDPDADAGAAFIQGGIASTANNAGSSSALASASSTGSVSLSGGGGIVSGTVYCLDCGMANDEQSDFCVRCMRPLIKRQMLDQLAAKKARVLFAVGRGDYVFLTCLSVVIVATVLMILYIFFRGVT